MTNSDTAIAAILTVPHTYTKRMDRRVGWIRRLDATAEDGTLIPVPDQPYARISGTVTEGWQEQGDEDDFIRWIGVFQAECPTAKGGVELSISRNLVFPEFDALLLPLFKEENKATKIEGRTGLYYSLQDFVEVQFIIDVYLTQPEGKSRRGFNWKLVPHRAPATTFSIAHVTEHGFVSANEPAPEGTQEPSPEASDRKRRRSA